MVMRMMMMVVVMMRAMVTSLSVSSSLPESVDKHPHYLKTSIHCPKGCKWEWHQSCATPPEAVVVVAIGRGSDAMVHQL